MFVDLSSTRFVDFEYDSVCEILEKKFEISYKQIERAEKQKQKQKEMFAQMRNFVIFFAIALIAGKILRSFFV